VGEDPGRNTRQVLSVPEAADALGVTVDAVRSRIKRGTIAHERQGGRVYVSLNADRPGQVATSQPTYQVNQVRSYLRCRVASTPSNAS
jgi:hypothetical protein